MENQQIWLKPKPTHIDENFEDFLNYLSTSENISDVLHQESLRLLKLRMSQLVEERDSTPIYRQIKTSKITIFNVRLCGAWLLSFKDATQHERKQVLLIMINNLLYLSISSENKSTLSYRSVPKLINMAIQLVTHKFPDKLTFTWKDLMNFSSLDQFINNFIEMKCETFSDGIYEGYGSMIAAGGKIVLSDHSKEVYDKKYCTKTDTELLGDYGFIVSSANDLRIKESQKDDIVIVEQFVNDILKEMRSSQNVKFGRRLLNYSEGEYVPVEVTEITSQKITLKTIDPNYAPIEGQLIFEQNLQIFSKVYPVEVWTKLLTVGDRLNVHIISPETKTFSLTKLFVDYIRDNVSIGDDFDAHNWKGSGDCLENREFWTSAGFMVYVNLSEQEDTELDQYERYAGIEIIGFGDKQFRGCLYGRICDYEADTCNINREESRQRLIERFIDDHSDIHIQYKEADCELIEKTFVKEFCSTLNIMQGRETNPMVRYKVLSIIRILCALIDSDNDDKFFEYIAKYIKTLILFAKADDKEGDKIAQFAAPEDLKDEETVRNGSDILKILSCFSKGYEETNDSLAKYIEGDNVTLSQTASLEQSYNRLRTILQ